MHHIMNRILERVKKRTVFTIAGRSGMGKTVVGFSIATILAKKNKVLYVDTEGILLFDLLELKFDFINISTISDIIYEIQKNEYDVVIIDSFQDIKNHKMKETAYMLKNIAQELDVAVIVLSHIPRKCDMRKEKRPRYSDMKDKKMCGYLCKYSDRIVFLYRDHYYFPDKDNLIEFIEYDQCSFIKRHIKRQIIKRIPFKLLMEKVYEPSKQ